MSALDFAVEYIVLATSKTSKTHLLCCGFFFFVFLTFESLYITLRLHIDYKVHLKLVNNELLDILNIRNHQLHIKLYFLVLLVSVI